MFFGITDTFHIRIITGFVVGVLGFFIYAPAINAQAPLGVAVTWRANSEPDLAGYYIYYGPQSHLYTNHVTVGPAATLARIEPLVEGATYYIAITAFNEDEVESFPSEELIYYAPIGNNTPPTISRIDNQVLGEDVPSASLTFTVADAESPASALIVKAHSSNPRLIPDSYILLAGSGAQRELLIVPQLEQSGSAQITLEVRDPQGAASTVSFYVFVVPLNDDPVISPIPNQLVNEDATTRVQFYVFDAESPPDDLLIIAMSSNQQLIPDENIALTGTGNSRALTFTPTYENIGSSLIQIYVIDPDGGYSGTQFTAVVRVVNDPPVVAPLKDFAVDEDSFTPAIVLNLFDIDSAVADVKLSGSSSKSSLVGPESFVFGGIGDTRTMIITPKPNQFGTCTVRVTATDSGGSASTTSFTLTVRPVNDPPNIDPIPSFSVSQGSGPLSVPLSGITYGPSNELQTLFVTAFSSNPGIIPDPVVDYVSSNKFGSLLIAPLPDAAGPAVITVYVSDGQATNSRSFTVSIEAINEPPVIYGLPDLAVLRIPTPLQQTFNVQDPDTPADRLIVTAYSSDPFLLPMSNLAVTGTGTQRTLTVSPVLSRTGVATVTIVVSDGETAVSASFYLLVSLGGL